MAPIDFSDDEPSRLTGFANSLIDRQAPRREDPAWIAAAMERPEARHVLYLDDRPLLDVSKTPLGVHHGAFMARALGADMAEAVFMGVDDEGPIFAAEITADADQAMDVGPYKFIDLRTLAIQGALDPDDLGRLAQARSLLHWHQNHGFCSKCGTKTAMSDAGYKRTCPDCGGQHFPRTDPVAIMLAVDGDKCLLGRSPHFAPGMYSCLAGFIEPGETIEDAVRREIMEEAGIRIGKVNYYASQPWPFPTSLMIGCHGEALSTEVTPDDEELEDCRWFDKDEVRLMLAGTHPDGIGTPPPMAIAHIIIRAFVEAE